MHRDGLDVALPLVQRVDELDVAVAAQSRRRRAPSSRIRIVDDDLRAVEDAVVGHERFSFLGTFPQELCYYRASRFMRAVVIGEIEILRGVRRGPAFDLLPELQHVVEASAA